MAPTFVQSIIVVFGFPEIYSATSVYLYPLANYTGTAEVVQGGTNGSDGLGSVSEFTPHPKLPYSSLYFHGTTSSFVELSIGTQHLVKNDWAFAMFVYSKAPHRGTIFDFVYDGSNALTGILWSAKMKLEFNESHIILTMQGPRGDDIGSAVAGTIFTAEEWIPLSVMHYKSSGDVIIKVAEDEIYNSKGIQSNQNKVDLAQPAKVKLGDSYDTSNPFEGSIVCFAIYDNVLATDLDTTIDECLPTFWPIVPPSIELPDITTPLETTQTTTTTTTTTSTSTPSTSTSTPSTAMSTPSTTTSTPSTSTSTPSTTTSTPSATISTPSATISTPSTTTFTPALCSELNGYFIAVAFNAWPAMEFAFLTTNRKTSRQCAQVCLMTQDCLSFAYKNSTDMCALFHEVHNTTLELGDGTYYYSRRDAIC